MRIHWHVAGESAASARLREWLDTCLQEQHRHCAHQAVRSWGIEAGAFTYHTPGREREEALATSWSELTRQARADLTVVLRPDGERGGNVSLTRGKAFPTRVHGRWRWAPGEVPDAPERRVLYPRLPLPWPHAAGENPDQITLLTSLAEPETVEAAYRLAAMLQREFPDYPLVIASEPACFGMGSCGWALPSVQHLPAAGTLVLCSGKIAWAPVVLEALAHGCRVIAPLGAAYAGYLADGRGKFWELTGSGEDVASHLRAACQDPEEAARRTRKAAAWARRWTVARTAATLEGWILELTQELPPLRRGSRPEWVLRREIGIGDIVFALCSAAALKERDPDCHLTFHTAPEHVEWVRWFPCVDAVTSGTFNPPPGVHVGDLERCFPNTAAIDRAMAMGQVVGVEARWPRPPRIPSQFRQKTVARLPRARRPRIAFVPASKARHMTRTLTRETAFQLAANLREQGTVIWLDAEPLGASVPDGIVDLSGQLTVSEALAVLAQCYACVSVDSGLLYLAASLGKPVVGLFTHIGALQRLWLTPRFVALQPSLPCAPCGEGPGAFSCMEGRAVTDHVSLPCVQLPWHRYLSEAVQCLLATSSPSLREVWNIGPTGERLTWNVDALPDPWLRTDRPLTVLNR